MKPTRLQFGVRENTASSRQHASRLEGPSFPLRSETMYGGSYRQEQTLELVTGAPEPNNPLNERPLAAATAGSPERTASANAPRQSFEPLIGCEEAAKLLGNIHVKTLQRYARKGALPGYRVAGHWYFRASELDSWLRSRINSSCHPCRSNEEAK
jgi:excisionase family DNA binding protein